MTTGNTFAAQVAEWVRETKERQDAVFRESSQRIIAIMQEPGYSVATVKQAINQGLGTTGRGRKKKAIQGPIANPGGPGNLPVDTGFLRASLSVSLDAPEPIDKGAVPEEGRRYSYDEGVTLQIAGAEIGQTVYATYTAAYARAANYGSSGRQGRFFVDLAAQRWRQTVEAVCGELQARSGDSGGTTPSN